jgi:hypothetical protein
MRGGKIIFSNDLEADWFFVNGLDWFFENKITESATKIPWERRIIFLMEPPTGTTYALEYVNQFGVLVSSYKIDGYKGRLVLGNTCLPWHLGAFMNPNPFPTLRDVENFHPPHKSKTISIVASTMIVERGHRKRVAFLSALMSRFGVKVDYYGKGFSSILDKFDAIVPYKYHIAIESCNLNNYWTEKLLDAWLAWCLPIYCGNPSILRQVPDPMGIEVIDISDPDSAMRHIDYILSEDIYSSRLEAIAACRKWAIQKSNPLSRVCEIIETSEPSVLNVPPLKCDEVIRGIRNKKHRTVGRKIRQALAWCDGSFHVWNMKRKHKKILAEKSA